MAKVTKLAASQTTAAEQSDTPTSSPAEPSAEKLPAAPTVRIVPHSVQFKVPLTILNMSGSLNQIGRSQAVILDREDGVWFQSHDERVTYTTKVPWGAIGRITYERIVEPKG